MSWLFYYRAATPQEAQQRFERAYDLYKQSLLHLGDTYRRDDLLDDTGMKLIVAEDFERKGEMGKASAALRRILEERLILYGEKYPFAPHRNEIRK